MNEKQFRKEFWVSERELGEYKVLSGRYSHDTAFAKGYVHEWHIKQFLSDWKIHTLIIHGGNGLGAVGQYYVLLEKRT